MQVLLAAVGQQNQPADALPYTWGFAAGHVWQRVCPALPQDAAEAMQQEAPRLQRSGKPEVVAQHKVAPPLPYEKGVRVGQIPLNAVYAAAIEARCGFASTCIL